MAGDNVVFATNGTSASLDTVTNIGLLTLNKPGGFSLTHNSNGPSINTGITVAPSDAGNYAYTINTTGGLVLPSGANFVINIASGSTLNMTVGQTSSNVASIKVTGGGALNLAGYGLQTGGYYANYCSTLNFDQGVSTIASGTYRFGGLVVNSGASVVPGAAMSLGVNYYGRGNSTITGPVGNTTYRTAISQGAAYSWGGASTITLKGDGRLINVDKMASLYGDIVLDDRDGFTTGSRFSAPQQYNLWYGGIKLIGNATVSTTESAMEGTGAGLGGHVVFEVQHGTGASARLDVGGMSNWASWTGGGIISFVGNDLNSATSTYTSTITMTGLLTQNSLAPYTNIPDSTGKLAFAARSGNTVVPYSGAVVTNLATALGTSHAQISGGPVTLNATAQAYTLRIIDGSPIDLGGNTLTLAPTATSSSGIIQTGADNTTGITNGTILAGVSGSNTKQPLTVMNDKALTIGAAINASGLYKAGPGLLTLTGALTFSGSGSGVTSFNPGIRWYEGSLVYNSPTSTTLYQYTRGNGSLTVKGPGVLTMDSLYFNGSSGGITITNGGSLVVNGDGLGTGGVTINAGGALSVMGTSTSAYAGLHTNVALAGGQLTVGYTSTNALPWATSDFGVSGNGTVVISAAAAKTFTQSGTWSPGNSAGKITVATDVAGNATLAFAKDAAANAYPKLVIDITGTGNVAGVDYDQLAGGGTNGVKMTGLNNLDLVVRLAPGLDVSSQTFTILTSISDFTGQSFRSVTWATTNLSGQVSLNNGSITLTNVQVPEPAGLGLLAAGGLGLLGRRRRCA